MARIQGGKGLTKGQQQAIADARGSENIMGFLPKGAKGGITPAGYARLAEMKSKGRKPKNENMAEDN